ncbi:Actin-related protein 6 [Escovopsis weberi]|uniref:Actin-related protein 6 n=1 Tax=Escovopsis weberi TaxID=150374 RepID=A0A0M8N3N8_ESCWE|nr:Actin-related protein 6 [Escovopsis weberi]
MAKTLVLDNGAWTLKAGFVLDGHISEPRTIPNCIARDRSRKVYVGAELSQCKDYSEIQFRRPVEKGFLVNWEAQKEIWDRELLDAKTGLGCDPRETRLVLTEQPNGLPVLQANCDQIVFEEYGFDSYYRGIGATFNAYHDLQSVFHTATDAPGAANVPAEVALVVDAGYSHTTITPLLRGRPLHSAVRRVDVGGKLLTNYMARLVSLRHFDVRNESYIVNDIKEQACFVSLDFPADLDSTWKGARGDGGGGRGRADDARGADRRIAKDYVLPDFHTRHRGALRDHDPALHSRARRLAAAAAAGVGGGGEGGVSGAGGIGSGGAGGAPPPAGLHLDEDVLTLRNERFAVPELLFHPSDVGMRQPGLAGALAQSLRALPTGLWPGLLANIVVAGGSTLFEGFVQRLQREVMQLVPDDCVVRVARPPDPLRFTWRGAANLAAHADVERLVVTRAEYEEFGAAWVSRRFATGLSGA